MSYERKYAMSKVGAGDYILPANDASVLWRLSTYEEDGSAEGVLGTFWGVWVYKEALDGSRLIDLGTFEDWEFWCGGFSRRADAMEYALSVDSARVQKWAQRRGARVWAKEAMSERFSK